MYGPAMQRYTTTEKEVWIAHNLPFILQSHIAVGAVYVVHGLNRYQCS